MADDTQQQPQQPVDINAALQALIQQQIAAASGNQQVQLPQVQAPPSQYSNDPSKGPGLLARIGLALGGGSLPGAPAELRQQMGAQALMNFGTGLMSAGRFATPGQALAGGFRGAQAGLLGSEAAQAGQQEYALNAQTKLAELSMEQQKNRTAALTALVPLLQMQGRLAMPPLFGGGAGGPGGGGGPGGAGDGQDIYSLPKDQFLPAVAQRESGGDPTALNYVAKADPTAGARGATASGKYQMVNSTWLTAAKAAGIDTNQYPTAASAPEALQDAAASKLYDMQGTKPWNPAAWTKNWVQGSDGKYTLQTAPYTGPPGASKGPPPTQGAGGPVGPYKPPAASTAAAGPPGSTDDSWFPSATPAPPAGGGGQLSIGDVALPPAPGSAANVVPGLSAADATAIAKRTGQDVPFGDQGMVAHPSGRVGTAGGGGFGKRADAGAVQGDVGAILAGMQGGGAGVAPDTVVQAAGPAAGGPPGIGSALAPPTPGLATSIGPVRAPVAPAQPPAPPAAQPEQPPTPVLQPPASSQTAPVRDLSTLKKEDFTLPEWQQYYHRNPTPDELVSRGIVLPQNAPEFRDAQAALTEAETNAANARNAAQNATNMAQRGLLGTTDVARLITAANGADKNAQDARDKYNALLHDTTKTNATGLAAFNKDQDDRLAADYKAQVVDPKAAATLAAADLNKSEIGAANSVWQQTVEKANQKAGLARQVRDQLEPAVSMVGNQPTSAFVRNLIQNNPQAATYLKGLGIVDPDQVDAATALHGVLSYVASELKPTGTGALREYEFNAINNAIGSGSMSIKNQRLALARILNLQDRIVQEGDAAGELWGDAMDSGNPRKGLGSVQKNIDAKLGPVIHNAATEMSPADLADPANVTKWLQSGVVRAGRPVMLPIYNDDRTLRRNSDGSIQTEMKVVGQ